MSSIVNFYDNPWMLDTTPISALLTECRNAPRQSKGISAGVTQAFLGQKTAQSHSSIAPGKLTGLGQILKTELLLFPQILWRSSIRAFETSILKAQLLGHQ